MSDYTPEEIARFRRAAARRYMRLGRRWMCQVTPADCRRYHIGSPNCIFDMSKITPSVPSNPPNWGARRGKKASDIPKRKSSVMCPRTGRRQRRIAVYNYRSSSWFKTSWQGELTENPRHVRWARRRRKERYSQ